MQQQLADPALVDVPTVIRKAYAEFLTRRRRQATKRTEMRVYASAWRECERRMVLELTDGDKLPEHPPELLAKFRRGEDRERDLLADLSRIGRDADPEFSLIGQQERFEVKDRRGRAVISGKVDARLAIGGLKAPIEVKAWSPQLVDRIETFDDLFENQWTQSGGYQLLSYLYGANEPLGFLLLDRSGLPALIPVHLETQLERMEAFLQKAERVVDHALAGTLPDFIDNPPACRRCPFFGGSCQPDLNAGDVQVFTDEDFERDLHRWYAIQEQGKEFASLDRKLKDRLRGVENGISGPFSITGRWGKYTRYDVPIEVRDKYKVVDPKGTFKLSIDKVIPDAPAPAATPIAETLRLVIDNAQPPKGAA